MLINENNRMFTAFAKKQLNEEGQPTKGSTAYAGEFNTQQGGEVYRETIKRRRSTVYKRLDEQDNIAVGDFVTDQDGQDGIITDIEGSVVSLRELGQEGWSTDYSKLIKGDYYGTSPGKPIVGDIVTTGEGETGVLTDIDGNTASIMEVGEYGWSADFSKIRKK